MHSVNPPIDFSFLTPEQRIELAWELWHSAHDELEKMPMPQWQIDELEYRLAEERAGRVTYSTWDEVKARLLSRP